MRVKFPSGQQRAFLEDVLRMTGVKADDLASRIGVCARTVRDWRRERWQIDQRSLQQLCQIASLPLPDDITLLPEHWSVARASRLGGLRRLALHGPPGTPEGRQRGGVAAQVTLRALGKMKPGGGWQLRKSILIPSRGEDLAEFIGIMLGDGCIRNAWQIGVSFNQHGDQPYAAFIRKMIERLFGLDAALYIRPSAADLVVSSTALVCLLQELGFPRGSKCETLVEVPAWIKNTSNTRIACLRGLMDTDGCVFRHRYRVSGKEYAYVKLAFASATPCLTQFVAESFQMLGISAHVRQGGQRVFVDGRKSVVRYFEVVGTHNPRYQQRFEEYSRNHSERYPSG